MCWLAAAGAGGAKALSSYLSDIRLRQDHKLIKISGHILFRSDTGAACQFTGPRILEPQAYDEARHYGDSSNELPWTEIAGKNPFAIQSIKLWSSSLTAGSDPIWLNFRHFRNDSLDAGRLVA